MPPKTTDSVDSDAGETTSLDEPSVGSTAEHSRSYSTRQQRFSEAWGGIRGKLRFAVIESSVPYDKCHCFLCCKAAHILCKQCGPQAYYCEQCVESQHSKCNIFHCPVEWKVIKSNVYSYLQ